VGGVSAWHAACNTATPCSKSGSHHARARASHPARVPRHHPLQLPWRVPFGRVLARRLAHRQRESTYTCQVSNATIEEPSDCSSSPEVSRATSAVDDDDADAATKSPRRASFASERSREGAAAAAEGEDSVAEVGALRFLAAAAAAAAAGAGMGIVLQLGCKGGCRCRLQESARKRRRVRCHPPCTNTYMFITSRNSDFVLRLQRARQQQAALQRPQHDTCHNTTHGTTRHMSRATGSGATPALHTARTRAQHQPNTPHDPSNSASGLPDEAAGAVEGGVVVAGGVVLGKQRVRVQPVAG